MIEVVEHIDKKKWEELIRDSSHASFFQTKNCYDFFSSLSFLKAFVFGLEVDGVLKGIICGYIIANGGMIKRFFSKRAIIHGGALLADDVTDAELSSFLEELKKRIAEKVIYIEFRNNSNYDKYRTVFTNAGFNYKLHLNYVVKTNDKQEFIEKMSESKRRQVRKAKDAGVHISETKNEKDIDEFYGILSLLYKRKVRKPLFPKEFFEKMVILSGAHLFVAKYSDKVIGGIACVEFERETLYEWFVCGDSERFNRVYPSVAVTNFAIEYAVDNHFATFDFMGAGTPNEPYGVRDFKEKFGGELVEFGRFIFVTKPLLYKLGRMAVKPLQKLRINR